MAIPKNMVPKNHQLTQQLKSISKELLFVLFMLALVLVLKPTTASAATLNVATGNGATNLGDSLCQIEEAINSINAQQNEGDCIATGTYGTDDTINLPNGTIDGSMMIGSGSGSGIEPVVINKSVKILGQGKDNSVIRNVGLGLAGSGMSYVLKDLAIKGETLIYSEGPESLTIDSLEVDFEGNAGYFFVDNPHNLTINNSYFHNQYTGFDDPIAMLIVSGGDNDWEDNQNHINITNSTFSDSSGGIMLSGSGLTSVAANLKNNTFSNMTHNVSGFATAIMAYTENSDSTINYTTTNNTFKDITGPLDGSGNPTAMAIFDEVSSGGQINHTAQNDVYAVGNGTAVNYYRRLDGSTPLESDITTTSLGGNISSDNSFGSRLNHATDQNNITTLASFLGTLTDNGGPVPTISLLANSPAIDSGTNVSGMTTDARGVTRPQGASFDSGAYELAVAEEPNNGNNGGGNSGSSNTTTTTNPSLKSPASSVSQFSNKPITITTPTGTTITDSNTVTESSLGAQDGNNQYPLGLVNFTFNTSQTDNQVTLTFITDLKPNQVKPRKYNPDTKAYTDLTNYTLTETTVDGKHALVLTYTITDNGDLDTNKTTGIISDPVGLAMSNSSYDQLANTGQNAILIAATGIVMVIAGVATTLLTKLKKTRYLFR
jgi:hypothetical protein